MTIALGMLASNGIVLATDTQETVQGYWKRHQGKMTAVQSEAGAFVIAGAGRSGLRRCPNTATRRCFSESEDVEQDEY